MLTMCQAYSKTSEDRYKSVLHELNYLLAAIPPGGQQLDQCCTERETHT